MNGVESFLLGRTLMKIGEEAMPTEGIGEHSTSVRTVLIVVSDLRAHPDTTVGAIAARTGLPQSAVSAAIARLRTAGARLRYELRGSGPFLLISQSGEGDARPGRPARHRPHGDHVRPARPEPQHHRPRRRRRRHRRAAPGSPPRSRRWRACSASPATAPSPT
ncbi:helix-turn-helix domain-containing protein [Nonomuraea maheshkhaliensis]|uniref:MarR family transcriptional regulator n=1 Tax=Nonomuraea maheshkhaliensis TaxID=419590 RepID=UPI0031FA33F8